MSDREYAESKVRAAWEKVEFLNGSTDTKLSYYVFAGQGMPSIAHSNWSAEDAWSTALAFTEQRLREIAEAEEGISLLRGWKFTHEDNAAAKRILTHEQAALVELKRGMKAEDPAQETKRGASEGAGR